MILRKEVEHYTLMSGFIYNLVMKLILNAMNIFYRVSEFIRVLLTDFG